MKKTIIVIAVVLVSALLLGVFATGSNLFGNKDWLSGFGYQYEVEGNKLSNPVEYFGKAEITTRVMTTLEEVTEICNDGHEFVLFYRLDEQHPSIKLYDADNGKVYFEQAIADLEGDYYGVCKTKGGEFTAVSGCAEILGAFVYRSEYTNFSDHFVKAIKNYKDSGDESHPYSADIRLDSDKYYVAYLFTPSAEFNGNDIDFELEGIESYSYTTTSYSTSTGYYKYVIFKPESSKVTFKLSMLNAKIQIYEIPQIENNNWSPTESTPGEFDVTEPPAGADVTTAATTVPEGADLPQIDPGAPEGPA
ncbi:MAG: hypothetical protein E7679_04835 [Ruminococcaceae bacterium]|nr:hypothetical protein [Oscillospiraceae bacterium]